MHIAKIADAFINAEQITSVIVDAKGPNVTLYFVGGHSEEFTDEDAIYVSEWLSIRSTDMIAEVQAARMDRGLCALCGVNPCGEPNLNKRGLVEGPPAPCVKCAAERAHEDKKKRKGKS